MLSFGLSRQLQRTMGRVMRKRQAGNHFVAAATIALALLLPFGGSTSAEEARGCKDCWRAPSGELYFRSAPPPGSVLVDAVRSSAASTPPTAAACTDAHAAAPADPHDDCRAPEADRHSKVARAPAARSDRSIWPDTLAAATVAPQPSPTASDPARRPTVAQPAAASDVQPAEKRWVELPPISCADVVEIRDSVPRIDFEMDEVDVTGNAHVTRGWVQDLKVCLAGNCVPVRGANVLRQGETAQFYIRGPRGRPQRLSVRCTVLER
jgi:hypothetical protein